MLVSQNYVTIDFETRIFQSAGVEIHYPICLAYKFANKPVELITDWYDIRAFIKSILKLKDWKIVAHNANYEMSVIKQMLKEEWNSNYTLQFLPTDIFSLSLGGPNSLADCGEHWELPMVKDPIGKNLIKVLSFPYSEKTPRKILDRKTADMVKKDGFIVDPELLDRMYKYCKKDVETTELLYQKLSFFSYTYFSQKMDMDYALNFHRNDQGINIDIQLVKDLQNALFDMKYVMIEQTRQMFGEDFNINSPIQVKKVLNSDPALSDLTSTNKKELIKALSLPIKKETRKLIDIRLNIPKNLIKRLERIDRAQTFHNFQYCGTGRTRRFTSFGFNFLNMPRKSKEVDVKTFYDKGYKTYEELKSLTRQCVIAKNIFFGGDFSQIDFRLLMLCSGEKEALKKIFNGHDYYRELAQKLYNKEEISQNQRYIAKRATLAFGYGLGLRTFIYEMAGEGIDISEQVADKLKNIYHQTFPKVRNFWRKQEKQFVATKHIILPFSGRQLFFPYVRKEKGDFYIKSKFGGWEKTWGGHLVALTIQSLTSDVFNWKIRHLAQHQFFCVIPFHDEVVCDVEDEKRFDEFKKLMKIQPFWLPDDFPLEGDFWKAKRYMK